LWESHKLVSERELDNMRPDMTAPSVDPIVSATFLEALRFFDKHPEVSDKIHKFRPLND
jgi:hypothetical protein